jgi:NAD(P)-dependent dehydrogenase (short-subunit alcohol dehydrogenase family)
MTALLTAKNIVIYGAGGGIGRGMAQTFAREGANLYLAGRTRAPLEAVASAVGGARVAEVDALDEVAVGEHLAAVVAEAGSIDASVNLVARGDVHGVPYVDMRIEDFLAPVTTGLTANFVTARAAAREMLRQGSGVILTITSGSSRGTTPLMGGTGPADAATEAFLRYLAAEVGPHGVRVLGLWTAGVRETFDLDDDTNAGRIATGMRGDDIDRVIGPLTMLRHTPRLDEVVDAAAFLISDRAAGMTATIANVTCGLVPGP